MPLYFFDVRENTDLYRDDAGVECRTLDQVREEAAMALVELARDRIPGAERLEMTIEVRDDRDKAVLKTSLTY